MYSRMTDSDIIPKFNDPDSKSNDSDSKSNDSDSNIFCVMCEDFMDDSGNKCDICGTEMCEECFNNRDKLQFTDWLYDVQNQCIGCKKIGCRDCIFLCYECATWGESFDTYCTQCKNFDLIDCKDHTWYVCDEHKNVECGTCYANRNYCMKHDDMTYWHS